MRIYAIKILISSLLFFTIINSEKVMAQDSLAKANAQDSINVSKTTILLRKIDSSRVADSLKRMVLLKEIEDLKGSASNKQRQELMARLKAEEAKDSISKAQQLNELAKLKATAKGYPVIPFSDTLFLVYTRVGSFPPNDRAEYVTDKIRKLYDDFEFKPDSLTLSKSESSTEIIYKEIVVMSVNELEALWFDKKSEVLAKEYQDIIASAIAEERSANSIKNILLRIAAIIVILVGIYFLIRLINRLFRRLVVKVTSLKESLLKGVKFKGYQFLDSDRELQLVLFFVKVFRLFIIGLALYITLPLLFSVFPWTRGIAETLLGWVTRPFLSVLGGIVNYLPNLFTILVIGACTHYVLKFLKFVSDEIEAGKLTIPGFYPDWTRPTFNIVKFLLIAFSFIMIFPYLPGSDSPIFQGVSVFIGIIFSFGSSSAISNAVAGLVITYMRPFKIGDRIKIGEIAGDVISKSLLVTRIRTIKNEDITIPNSSVLSGHTINYTTSANELGLILNTSVTIGYDVPWTKVHELLISAALSTKRILTDENKKPFVLQTSLNDFYVSYQLNAFTRESYQTALIYSELHQNIQDKFNEAGVEILSPHYRAARDGNMTTVPANYLAKDYQAPSFNVNVKKSE